MHLIPTDLFMASRLRRKPRLTTIKDIKVSRAGLYLSVISQLQHHSWLAVKNINSFKANCGNHQLLAAVFSLPLKTFSNFSIFGTITNLQYG